MLGILSLYVVLSLLPLARAGKGSVDLSFLGKLQVQLERLESLQQPWKLVNYQGALVVAVSWSRVRSYLDFTLDFAHNNLSNIINHHILL